MRCPQCRGEDSIEIEIRLKEEDDVQFYSCRLCEAKWWQRDGDTIALGDVLDLASKKK
ncbi:MAG: hypothetical protein M3516_10335 [Actinomycetota bacterium]|nr:hypothetical protein [Actinomycetota bacterium]